jgi:hypothetical protein
VWRAAESRMLATNAYSSRRPRFRIMIILVSRASDSLKTSTRSDSGDVTLLTSSQGDLYNTDSNQALPKKTQHLIRCSDRAPSQLLCTVSSQTTATHPTAAQVLIKSSIVWNRRRWLQVRTILFFPTLIKHLNSSGSQVYMLDGPPWLNRCGACWCRPNARLVRAVLEEVSNKVLWNIVLNYLHSKQSNQSCQSRFW